MNVIERLFDVYTKTPATNIRDKVFRARSLVFLLADGKPSTNASEVDRLLASVSKKHPIPFSQALYFLEDAQTARYRFPHGGSWFVLDRSRGDDVVLRSEVEEVVAKVDQVAMKEMTRYNTDRAAFASNDTETAEDFVSAE